MSFYARPTERLSPGDIFPSIPFASLVHPLKVARHSPYNPQKGRGPAEFRRIHTLPADQPDNLKLSHPDGEEVVVRAQSLMAMFLTWGSDVDDDEARIQEKNGRVGRRSWLAAPILELSVIPANDVATDPDTKQKVLVCDLFRQGKVHHAFYLPPFPGADPPIERYVDLRKATTVGVQFFRDSISQRIATLTETSLNELFTQLMWCLTRAELFFRPVRCECGREVPIDVRFHGQNFDAEPWQKP